ncbi:DUF4411 family protein [Burkholderia sp. Bp8963]|nr:DUF4411 family protein [Burkholderia sp. Bp8963]
MTKEDWMRPSASLMLKPNAAKIPNVCVHIGVSCIDLEEFKYQQD